jgi:hypothetical protein
MTDPADSRLTFLPLAEAAGLLGVSRLKLREAIAKGLLPARRDNEGRWRADLTAAPADLVAATALRPAPPEALMGALFDEIEELSAEAEATGAAQGRLADLVAAQAAALDRALTALEARSAERDRLAHLTGRALAAADLAEARATALRATADRALALADRATVALEAAEAEAQRLRHEAGTKDTTIEGQAGALDRLFALSENALDMAARARAAPGLMARVFGKARTTR